MVIGIIAPPKDTVKSEEPVLEVVEVGTDGVLVMVNVKFCNTLPALLVAVIVIGYTPFVPLLAMPLKLAVPSPLSVKVRPAGSAPDSMSTGVDLPVVVNVKSLAVIVSRIPVTYEDALVMTGFDPYITVTALLLLLSTPEKRDVTLYVCVP
jgi:hypothetical protein